MKLAAKANPFAFLTSSGLGVQVVKGTAANFLIQGGFAGLSFVTATVLARWLGSEGYGAYSNGVAWANILATLGLFGFNTLLLRDIAILRAQGNWALIKGFLRFSDWLVLGISLASSGLLLLLGTVLFPGPEQANLRVTLWIAAPLIPLWTFASLRQAAMRGLEHVTRSVVPDLVVRPALTLAFMVGMYLLWPARVNSQSSVAMNIAASAFALLVAVIWLNSFLPERFREASAKYEVRQWLKVAPAMFVIGGTQILISQAPIVMLGAFSSARAVGYFAVAFRVASLLAFLPIAASIVLAPIIARLHSQGEKARLQNILKQATRLCFIATLLPGLVFLIFRRSILSFFGPEYAAASTALVMLISGYIVDAMLGISIVTLSMTGHENAVARYQTAFAVVLILLCTFLSRSTGYDGASLAFMLVMILSRIVFAMLAIRKTGLNTTVF